MSPQGGGCHPMRPRSSAASRVSPLVWEEEVPDDAERPETLLVIASTKPLDFRLLETPRGDGPDCP